MAVSYEDNNKVKIEIVNGDGQWFFLIFVINV